MPRSLKYFACTKVVLVVLDLLLFVSNQVCVSYSGNLFSYTTTITVISNLQCTGMVFIGIGIWFRVDPKMYEPTNYIETANYIYAAWIMMFTGLAMVIMSFVGCIGICTNSTARLGFVSTTRSSLKWSLIALSISMSLSCQCSQSSQ